MSAADLTKALGGRWHGRYGIARCAAHADRSPSLSIADGADDELLVHCHAGCSQREVIAALQRLGLWPVRSDAMPEATEAEKERRRKQRIGREREREIRAAYIEKVWRWTWDSASPARGSPVENWLRVRGIVFEPAELDRLPLRWTDQCPHGRSSAPAMLALMTDAITAEPCGLHRTFLLPDGSAKAFGKDSRMMLGPAGIMRLSPDDAVSEGLGICEGIETGLAIMATGWRPIWAAGSLDGLKQFPVLAGIECLTVFADPKPQEVAGARACAARWAEGGREAIIRIPGGVGDWNDVLQVAA